MNYSNAGVWAAGLLLASSAGLAAPGASQFDPVLPSRITTDYISVSGQIVGRRDHFQFDNPVSGLWFDPPMVDGFVITLGGGALFNGVTAPTGFIGLKLRVDGSIVDANFEAGETFSFGSGVKSFDILNVRPLLDPAAANFGTALPLNLTFTGSTSTMLWTSLPSAVPESDAYLLLLGGLTALGLLTRGRRSASSARPGASSTTAEGSGTGANTTGPSAS